MVGEDYSEEPDPPLRVGLRRRGTPDGRIFVEGTGLRRWRMWAGMQGCGLEEG
jgi:hypothetical protein